MNFAKNNPQAVDSKDPNPTYITTARGSFSGNEFSSMGFQNDVLYGLEIELAYDPDMVEKKNLIFTLMGRGVDKIKYTGTILTTRIIEGAISGQSPSGGVNLSFKDMLNKSTTNTINASSESSAAIIGTQIDDGIAKNNPFF